MEKINIAEILRNCPRGMELYSPIFGKVYLDKIRPHLAIVVTTDKEQGDFKEEFLYDGRYGMNGECVLFPSKDQRDWSKFQRPFKDGDIVVNQIGKPFILKSFDSLLNKVSSYCGISCFGTFELGSEDWTSICDIRFATDEEKQELFDAIKANGYRWNQKTKILEKLIKPKKELVNFDEAEKEKSDFVGDGFIKCFANFLDFKEGETYWLEYIGDDKYNVRSDNLLGKTYHITPCQLYTIFKKLTWFEKQGEKPQDKSALEAINEEKVDNQNCVKPTNKVKPKFKAGDKIVSKNKRDEYYHILHVTEHNYILNIKGYCLEFKDQDNWELVTQKFGITAKELKEALVNVPDDAEVYVDGYIALRKVINVEYDEYNNRFIIA